MDVFIMHSSVDNEQYYEIGNESLPEPMVLGFL